MNKILSSSPTSKQVITRTMATFKKVTHIIFDMDGLLLDTETLYTKAYQTILEPHGAVYTWEFQETIMGLPREEIGKRIIAHYDLPISLQDYLDQIEVQIKLLMSNCVMMPGAERLVRHLKAENIPICVATSSGEDAVAIKSKNHRAVFDLFHHIVCGSTDPEVKEGKPKPYIFQIAAQRYDDKPHPDQCLVFEDAPNGVRAANAAGMQVVMVPDKKCQEMREHATLVLDSLEDFQPELFGLPPFKK